MLSALTDKVLAGLAWIRGVHYDIADFFEDAADRAGAIPIVGGGLENVFNGIAGFFDHLGDEISDLARHVSDISDAIDTRLGILAELWSDVHGWISDKLDDAYNWADRALDQVAGLARDVDDLLDEVFRDIPRRLSSFQDQVDELVRQVFTAIPARISTLVDNVGDLLHEVFTGIPARFAAMLDTVTSIPDLVKGEVLQSIAAPINLVETFFEDINNFFSDPPAYFEKKMDKLGTPFAERLWGVIEKILERVW